MATKLQVYNAALRHCKERKLSAIDENREPRRLLDDVWDQGGVDACLEEGLWKFATRAVQIDYDADYSKEFGYQYQFSKPSDWKKTVAVCSDEYFRVPLLDYVHEAGNWYADLQKIYVRYVSNDSLYGMDLSLWPSSFFNYVSFHFANEIVSRVTGGNTEVINEVAQKHLEAMKIAKANDAWNQPQAFPASGSWTRSRMGAGKGARDFGNRGQLIG